jgi:hypothetical protein
MKLYPAIVLLLIAVSIGYSSYKSVASESALNGNGVSSWDAAQAINSSIQDKLPCTLTVVGAPVINGLRLRMTASEVVALFPGAGDDAAVKAALAKPPSALGVSELVIRPAKYEAKENQATPRPGAISQITIAFLDGRVSSFTAGFNGPPWPHVDNFVAHFVEVTSLPPADQWEAYSGMDTQLKILKCAEFEARVFAGGEGGNLNYVLIKDLEAEKTLKDRRIKARAKASPSP